MREKTLDHRPVTSQVSRPDQIEWLGKTEAARLAALLHPNGRAAITSLRQDRRKTDRRAG